MCKGKGKFGTVFGIKEDIRFKENESREKMEMKKVTRKIIAMGLAMIMLSGSVIVIPAEEACAPQKSNGITVLNLSDSITENEIEKITDGICAGLLYEDGSTENIDTVVVVEEIKEKTLRSNYALQDKSYKVTVSAGISQEDADTNARKIVSDSADKNGSVVASATLQLVWTDVLGWNNTLDRVSGTLTVESGKVTSGKVRYGNGIRSALLWTEKNVGSSTSFSYTPNLTVYNPAADYNVEFEGTDFSLYIRVAASIFQ